VAREDPTGGQRVTFVQPWTERGDYSMPAKKKAAKKKASKKKK